MSAFSPIFAVLRSLAIAFIGALFGFFLALFLCIMGMALYAALNRVDMDFTVAYRLAAPIAAGVFFVLTGIYWMVREFRSSR